MRTLIITTKNKGKFPEIVEKLKGLSFEFKNLLDVGYSNDFEIEEPGSTFEGNAIIKAMTIGKQTGELTLADDSGLMVDALDGRPGVFSARYAPGTDEDRYKKLLSELNDVPDEKRLARFKAVIAVYDPKTDKIILSEGTCEGKILREPKGQSGFGYDPIFESNDLGKTNAEASLEEKNEISHRGKALEKMKDLLVKANLN